MYNSYAINALAQYNLIADRLHQSSIYKPFIYPHYALGPYLVIAYLLIPPIPSESPFSKPVFYLRYPLFALLTYISVLAILGCRSATMTVGYGIGLVNAWIVLWLATLIIFGDARGEYARLEKRKRSFGRNGEIDELRGKEGRDTGFVGSGSDDQSDNPRRRDWSSEKASLNVVKESSIHSIDAAQTYVISQPLPANFTHRLHWVVDLVTNFRGINWTYGSFEPSFHLCRPKPPYLNPPTNIPSRRALLIKSSISLLIHYILLDTFKTISLLDPYYATNSSSSPSPFPLPFITRLLLSLISTYTALGAIFLLAPFFSQLLGPTILGAYSDPELYPPFFGPLNLISTKGIAGFWAGTWHPIFRLAFEAAGDFCARPLGPAWSRRTAKGITLRSCIAFFLSGCLHACGSYTTLPPTQPLSRAFLFFAIQPLGILAQRIIISNLPFPRNAFSRKVANWATFWVWTFISGPLIADDFAASGIWMFEPVPVSLWRGGKLCWRGDWVRVWKGEKWWDRGLAL